MSQKLSAKVDFRNAGLLTNSWMFLEKKIFLRVWNGRNSFIFNQFPFRTSYPCKVQRFLLEKTYPSSVMHNFPELLSFVLPYECRNKSGGRWGSGWSFWKWSVVVHLCTYLSYVEAVQISRIDLRIKSVRFFLFEPGVTIWIDSINNFAFERMSKMKCYDSFSLCTRKIAHLRLIRLETSVASTEEA